MSLLCNIILFVLFHIIGAIIGFWIGTINAYRETLFRLFWFGYLDLDEAEEIAKSLKQAPTDANCKQKYKISIKDARRMLLKR